MDERTVVVTGSSKGIGKALAKRFAAEGATVVTNSRDGSRAERVAEEIRADGG
ncbi:short-chain dehydrogenase/reductase SDR [Natrialba aegyptia DSM 13077]|uniref:Short-chain dehydrogenase/reductase SDR n=1 Tax=Natrialba aegyptia DSM 13077 TaxID=1227491 RepID=M0AH80_9EURY|nr:short-chain dehydrogenase/reductase SDR [Natrialba aegyptia DSM 13077]